MYYIWLAKFAGVEYVGRPQGNDINTKPFKSKIFKYLSIKGINSAKAIIVDSFVMYESIKKFTDTNNVFVIPNSPTDTLVHFLMLMRIPQFLFGFE